MSVKISELPILDSLADNDVIAGVDTSANVTSKIEMATLKNYIDTNTQYTAGTNIDITNNVVSAPNVYNKTEIDTQIEELQNEVDSLSTIYNAFPTESGEGESLTLDDTAEVKFKKFDLKGNTSQTGTPTPSSPIPVNVVSGDNEIVVNGVNLLKQKQFTTTTANGITFTPVYENGLLQYININGTATADVSYMVSEGYATTNLLSGGYTNSDTIKILGTGTSDIKVYTNRVSIVYGEATASITNAVTNELQWMLYRVSSGATINNVNVYPFAYNYTKLGDVSYEPYQGNTYNIDLPEGIELCKIGDYQDYFYKDNGKWYLHKEINKKIYNGTEDWTASGLSVTGYKGYYINDFTKILSANSAIITNYFKQRPYADWSGLVQDNFVETSDNAIGFRIQESLASNLANWKTWLGNNNVSIYYALATSTNTEITYQPLIDQLNLLEKAMSKDSQTNISQVSNDKPFILDVTAIKSLQNVLDRIELLES